MPEDWKKAIIVPIYKGKGKREECKSCRGISLLSVPREIYGRILNERIMKKTDKSVGDEQGGFQKGRGCVWRMIVTWVKNSDCVWWVIITWVKDRDCVWRVIIAWVKNRDCVWRMIVTWVKNSDCVGGGGYCDAGEEQ